MALPSASSTHKTGYKGTIAVSVVTPSSKGETQTPVSSVTYTNCENITLPVPESSMVEIPHLAGVTVVDEGDRTFGELTFSLPEDALDEFSAVVNPSGTKAEFTIVVAVPSLGRKFTGRGHFASDGGAQLARGQAFSRQCRVRLVERMTRAAI
jgi:DsbC/DsbD-like thiol-disulfide interchange protein